MPPRPGGQKMNGLEAGVGPGAQLPQLKCVVGTQFKPLCREEKGWGDEIGFTTPLLSKLWRCFKRSRGFELLHQICKCW